LTTSPFANVFSASTQSLKIVGDATANQPVLEQSFSGVSPTGNYTLNGDFYFDNDVAFKASNNFVFFVRNASGTVIWSLGVLSNGAVSTQGGVTQALFTASQQTWYNFRVDFNFSAGTHSGYITSFSGAQTASWSSDSLSSSFDGSGKLQFFDNTSGLTPTVFLDNISLATSAIPEPSTYAAICGAAVLGLAVWRRKRRAA
jgi:hypothetical protein